MGLWGILKDVVVAVLYRIGSPIWIKLGTGFLKFTFDNQIVLVRIVLKFF
jgi:hypothetical protein